MMLLETPANRHRRHDLGLGATTSVIAGAVNVCSVIAFFAFASNVTGHVAIFAEELAKGHWHQVGVVVAWLGLFIAGAFTANFSVTGLDTRSPRIGRALPLLLELTIIAGVGYYGHHHYQETLTETEYLVGILLFTMGLQNSMVASVSNGVVKTTHLTGLSTDLGMELSMMLQPKYRQDDWLRFKLKLHLVIFSGYVMGGIMGGVAFLNYGFQAFYFAAFGLVALLSHDLVVARMGSPRSRVQRGPNSSTASATEVLPSR